MKYKWSRNECGWTAQRPRLGAHCNRESATNVASGQRGRPLTGNHNELLAGQKMRVRRYCRRL